MGEVENVQRVEQDTSAGSEMVEDTDEGTEAERLLSQECK